MCICAFVCWFKVLYFRLKAKENLQQNQLPYVFCQLGLGAHERQAKIDCVKRNWLLSYTRPGRFTLIVFLLDKREFVMNYPC